MPPALDTTALAAPSRPSPSSPSHECAPPLSPSALEQARELEALADEGLPVLISCEPSPEGVLSGVGLAYLAHLSPDAVRLAREDACQPTLMEATFCAREDAALAERVLAGFEASCARSCPRSRTRSCGGCSDSGICMRRLTYALASDDAEMPEVVHRYLRLGFDVGARIRDMGSHPHVAPLDELSGYVAGECERTRQFVRFSRMSDGVFFALHKPRANVLPFVGGYFRARMGTERWCVVDPVHGMALMHDSQLVVTKLDPQLAAAAASRDDLAPDEHYVRSLWKLFYDRVSLDGRSPHERGYDLRTQLMPKRVWENMPEFDPRNDDPGMAPERYRGTTAPRPLLPM